MKRIIKKMAAVLAAVITIMVIAVTILLIVLSVREYKPSKIQEITISGKSGKKVSAKQEISVMTWNVGYGALSESEDFFMDGGKKIRPKQKSLIESNIKQMKETMRKSGSQIVFLQETDQNSKRSYYVDEVKKFSEGWNGTGAYARNFLCDYIPYPFPTIGKVDAGLLTLNRFETEEAKRISLPTPFSWPLRICQLKRCLLMEKVPIEGSKKKLVLVNLHLEAYDDGSGKREQTKLLAKILDEEYQKGNYVVAGGDFNQTFSQVDPLKYPVIDDEYFQAGKVDETVFEKGWKFAVDDRLPSCRLLNRPYDRNDKNTQFYVIDGFILSPNIELTSVKTLDEDFKNSDHNPVQMKIKLK